MRFGQEVSPNSTEDVRGKAGGCRLYRLFAAASLGATRTELKSAAEKVAMMDRETATIDLADKDARQFGRQRSEGDGDEREERTPSTSCCRLDRRRRRFVTRRPSATAEATGFEPSFLGLLLTCWPPCRASATRDLNAAPAQYLRATASIYSRRLAWRRSGTATATCSSTSSERVGCQGWPWVRWMGGSEVHKQHTDWIYGRHKRLFQTDPSVWRKSSEQKPRKQPSKRGGGGGGGDIKRTATQSFENSSEKRLQQTKFR
uniref:Uncharacterized protein n=1 Tax=Macrostomum lignano TaxID=282301 RepID=A0A1I8JPY8_9PLAT